MNKQTSKDQGFILIETVVALGLSLLLILALWQQMFLVQRIQKQSTLKIKALTEAINKMEELKFEPENFLGETLEEEKEGFILISRAQAFSDQVKKLEVEVKTKNYQTIFSLQTLRR